MASSSPYNNSVWEQPHTSTEGYDTIGFGQSLFDLDPGRYQMAILPMIQFASLWRDQ